MNGSAVNRDKKYAEYGWLGESWLEEFRKLGVLPKRKLQYLWQFDKETIRIAEGLERGDNGIITLARALIKMMMKLDLIFEHTGLLDDARSSLLQEYYLVPEVWGRQLANQSRRMNAQAFSSKYNPRVHMMMGWQADVEGWLMSSFFRKFMCECATKLANVHVEWRGGKVTLGRDAILWESAEWPGGRNGLALWLERSEKKKVTVKVAGRIAQRSLMKEMYKRSAEIMENIATSEVINVKDFRIGTLPPGAYAEETLAWVTEEDIENRSSQSKYTVKFIYNGNEFHLPLYYFDASTDSNVMIPNFDNWLQIRRQNSDPEFLLHWRKYSEDMTAYPSHKRKVWGIVKKVMGWHWFKPSLAYHRTKLRDLLKWPEIMERIRVVDLKEDWERNDMEYVDLALYVRLPSRNLYVAPENFHSEVLTEFANEVLDLFEAMRAKSAKVTIKSSDEHSQNFNAEASTSFGGGGGSLESQTSRNFELTTPKEFSPPQGLPGDAYPVNTKTWFFLAGQGALNHADLHGLDLGSAIKSLLKLKNDRVKNGAKIGPIKLHLYHSKSDKFDLFAKAQGFGELSFGMAKSKTLAFDMEYEAEIYKWNDGKWE